MPIWRGAPPVRQPPWQPQPRVKPQGLSGPAPVTYPLSGTITQAQTLALTSSKVFLRTVSLTQAQSATVALRPSVRYFLTGTATQAQSVSVAVLQARLPNNYYTTTFPATENPISESNVWSLGGTDGLDWHNART